MEPSTLPVAAEKRRVLILCWVLYTLSYLLRRSSA